MLNSGVVADVLFAALSEVVLREINPTVITNVAFQNSKFMSKVCSPH